MNELHLFAGAGGGILGGQLLGHRCICAVENEPYAQAILVARQNDGTFPPFPIFGDVCEFDGRPWRGFVDVVAGGFPCQDVSAAGTGAGIEGERSGLWSEMARIVREVQPRYVFVENSPMLTSRGLGVVLGDLAGMGFDAEWCVLGADDLGAPHRRKRIWILAHAHCERQSQPQGGERDQRRWAEHCGQDVANPPGQRRREGWAEPAGRQRGLAAPGGCGSLAHSNMRQRGRAERALCAGGAAADGCGADVPDADSKQLQRLEPESQPGGFGRQAGLHGRAWSFPGWPADPADAPESGLDRVVDGMAHRSHRIKAIGNGQVPRVAAAAFLLLQRRLKEAA